MTLTDFHFIVNNYALVQIRCYNCSTEWTIKSHQIQYENTIYCPKCGCGGKLLYKSKDEETS